MSKTKKVKVPHPTKFDGTKVKSLVLELDQIRKNHRRDKYTDKEKIKVTKRVKIVYQLLHDMGTYYMRQLRKRREGIGIWA